MFPGARGARYGTTPGAVYNAPGVLGVLSRCLRQAAVAGERSQVQIRNPGASNVVLVVEQIVATTTAAAITLTGRKGSNLATAPIAGARDASANAGSRGIGAAGTDDTGVIIPVLLHGAPAGEAIELIGARDLKVY